MQDSNGSGTVPGFIQEFNILKLKNAFEDV